MRLKIFSCHHLLPQLTCNTEIFQTFVSNQPEPEDGSFMSDLSGVNIAGDNLYAELRHQFYVWKNLFGAYDYVGFEHYRRVLFIDPLPEVQLSAGFPSVMYKRRLFATYNMQACRSNLADFEQYLAMRRSLDGAVIEQTKEFICNYDVVVPRPNNVNIEEQWKGCIPDLTLWDIMVEGVNKSRIFHTRRNYVFFQTEICYSGNIYIMRCDLLDEYLTFCFEVLEYIRSRLAVVGRALGYFSERLFTFWLYPKRKSSCPLYGCLSYLSCSMIHLLINTFHQSGTPWPG